MRINESWTIKKAADVWRTDVGIIKVSKVAYIPSFDRKEIKPVSPSMEQLWIFVAVEMDKRNSKFQYF